MQQLAQVYNEMTELTLKEQLEQRDDLLRYNFQDPQDAMRDELYEMGMPITHDDITYIEHRVYHDYVGTVDFDLRDPNHAENSMDRSWTPYEQDLTQYPEVFKKYQENYDRYEKVKERFENEDQLAEAGEGAFVKRLPKDMSPWETKYDTSMPRYTGASSQ